MSYLEKQLGLIDQVDRITMEKKTISKMNKESILQELSELRKKFETSLERISIIESFLGVSKTTPTKSEKPKPKRNEKYSISKNEDINNIILIEKDDDVPEGYECIIVVCNENKGEIILIRTEDLKELCKNIIINPIGQNIQFPPYKPTNKHATLNDNGEWEMETLEEISVE